MPHPVPDRPLPVTNPLQYRAPKPVYWLVCVRDQETGRIYHSRWASHKYETPREAYDDAYGRGGRISGNLLFFNLTSNVATARKLNRAINFHFASYHQGASPPVPDQKVMLLPHAWSAMVRAEAKAEQHAADVTALREHWDASAHHSSYWADFLEQRGPK
jgi:hypothetical protein